MPGDGCVKVSNSVVLVAVWVSASLPPPRTERLRDEGDDIRDLGCSDDSVDWTKAGLAVTPTSVENE